ncbi:hypothetical protein ACHAWF_018043 [Thalassiosira exigua]
MAMNRWGRSALAIFAVAATSSFLLFNQSLHRVSSIFSLEIISRVDKAPGAKCDNRSSFIHPPYIYGHIHMAKTGGTNLNGLFANKFERICGNKGYSYDFYYYIERFNKSNQTRLKMGTPGQVPPGRMKEIGFENCDFISVEYNWRFWGGKFFKEERFMMFQ